MIVSGIYYNGQLIPEGYVDGKLLFDFEPPAISTLYYDDELYLQHMVNYDFSNGIGGWSGGGWTVSNGVAIYDGAYGQSGLVQSVYLENGVTYRVQVDCNSNQGSRPNTIQIGFTSLFNEHLLADHSYIAYITWANASGDYDCFTRGEPDEVLSISMMSLTSIDTEG